ncbi:hypothetical protein [Desulfovibrio sp. UCD-KL4C]|uniref:carboxymuconolactone decarboxylase family protein n=1 Tax=Desulfovibrio sp. UCD-KL4C TaxID=2578120 RepID=UPI0025C6D55E|nr:hypothetical protein [Desulfovibrio sp. UCD-KL4C]
MFKLDYVTPEKAEGSIKEAYSIFPPQMGIPTQIQMYSVSPALLTNLVSGIKYFASHPKLTFPMLTAIRLMSAHELCYDYCVGLNLKILKLAGMNESEINSLLGDMEEIPFEENEKILLKLVQKVINAPKSVTDSDMQKCREAGWADSDIFDAAYQGSILAVSARLSYAFEK